MSRPSNRKGASIPFWFECITDYTSIATADFDPIATYKNGAQTSALLSKMNSYVANGFGVKNATDNAGYIYAITYCQYDDYLFKNPNISPASIDLSGITPRQIDLAGHEWCVTPIVKVFADNAGGGYASTVVTINVGRIL
jgi:hypothetical protein